jgi:hypothetical protein
MVAEQECVKGLNRQVERATKSKDIPTMAAPSKIGHAIETTMPEPAEDMIIRNLIESLERLRGDLDRMELWAAALGYFQQQAPEYQPSDRHLLKAPMKRGAERPARGPRSERI